MRCSRCLSLVALGMLAAVCAASPLVAQNQFGGSTIDGSGTVVGIDPANLLVQVRYRDGHGVILDFKQERVSGTTVITGLPNPTASVVGTTTPAILSPGMTVRVTGKVKDMEEFVDPITEIDVTGLGINPTGTYGALTEPMNLTDEEEADGVQGFVVHGRLERIRRGKIYILIPTEDGDTETIEGAVAEGAQVNVDVPDARLAQVGDRVDFTGYTLDARTVFVYNATFTKPDPNNPNAGAGQRQEEFHGPEGARPPRQAFGAGIPDVGQGDGQDPAEDAAPADDAAPAEDVAMPAEGGEPAAPEGDEAPAEVAAPAEPETPGRVLRVN